MVSLTALRIRARKLFPDACMHPSFLVIGAQKAGSTAIYNYLRQHPQVMGANMKEVNYFLNLQKLQSGYRIYRSCFPLKFEGKMKELLHGKKVVTGEASPGYLYFSKTASEIHKYSPNIKMIALLRNPTDRAFSHYHHNVRLGLEPHSFSDAIALERSRLVSSDVYASHDQQHYSYARRGLYVHQLKNFQKFFKLEDMYLYTSEDFFKQPQAVMSEIFAGLGLEPYDVPMLQPVFSGDYQRERTPTHDQLDSYFRPYNRELETLLKRKLGWVT